jgi:uncharacterized protein (TIGR02453 family)
MISKSTFNFLVQLKENNNREWFQSNKVWYDESKEDFENFVSKLISEINQFHPEIGPIDPKSTVFRIYRDVRFSRDKAPYKTNMGAHVVVGGKKSGNAGYYFHLEPDGSFLAGGAHMPSPDQLKTLRKEIYENIDEFLGIINNKGFSQYFGELMGEKLVNPPRGFPADFPHIELLKHKGYTVWKSLPDDTVQGQGLLKELGKGFRIMKPFIDFINYSFGVE